MPDCSVQESKSLADFCDLSNFNSAAYADFNRWYWRTIVLELELLLWSNWYLLIASLCYTGPYEVVWKEQFIFKLEAKHAVYTDEVETVLFANPFVRLIERGNIKGENLYAAYGQTDEGRYLIVFFVLKPKATALSISVRDMTQAERKYYERHK